MKDKHAKGEREVWKEVERMRAGKHAPQTARGVGLAVPQISSILADRRPCKLDGIFDREGTPYSGTCEALRTGLPFRESAPACHPCPPRSRCVSALVEDSGW